MENKETLEEIYSKPYSNEICEKIPKEIQDNIKIIGKNCIKRKGVYTVLTTLLYYKYTIPKQDIRLFQTKFENGFSARSYDTKYITPILKKLGLPAMAESGWLTRSLEQPYPYDLNYKGAIPTNLKMPFLNILEYIQNNPDMAYNCLCILLNEVKKATYLNIVSITPLKNCDNLTIDLIMKCLKEHFTTNYHTKGGAKLPVLAFYAIYTSLINELFRYKDCKLANLSSLTARDKTNKASGDIEIFRKNDELFEAIEIKLDKKIDTQIVMIAKDKIYKWNPQRYYILSVLGINENDSIEIQKIVDEVKIKHGCQIIINGLLPTLKYYLRLIENLSNFINTYSQIVEKDKELEAIHKEKWNELIEILNG